jgi:hypothetical protein
MNKKRFELERERQSAEKGRKVQDSQGAEGKRVVRDHYEGGSGGQPGDDREGTPERPEPPRDEPRDEDPPPDESTGRKIDVVA